MDSYTMNDTSAYTSSEGLFPACYVEFPPSVEGRSATFFLAAEEYVASHADFAPTAEGRPQAYLFTWRLRPTVVMGRNQVAHQEIDLDFCRAEGIDIVRRKSGGGAIFADERNIMTSLVTGSGAVEPLFQAYAHAVSTALNSLGATTEVSGRNDILLNYERDGETLTGKICGNAFYHLTDHNIVHGTMLYDTDPRKMMGALHPDQSKLRSAGVKSVRSRVALLKDVLPFGVSELRDHLRCLLTDRCIVLSSADVQAIEEIEREYRTPEFLYGRRAELTSVIRQRIQGVGTLELHLALHNGKVEALQLMGDFFHSDDDAEALFRQAFQGYAFTPTVIAERIADVHPESAVRNLTAEALNAFLTDTDIPKE